MSFTKGPWKRYEGYGAEYRKPVITDAMPDRDGKCVANCICYVATTNDDWDANAKLIAAAPELLEACEMAQHELQCLQPDLWNEDTDVIKEIIKRLQAAIKKARGQ